MSLEHLILLEFQITDTTITTIVKHLVGFDPVVPIKLLIFIIRVRNSTRISTTGSAPVTEPFSATINKQLTSSAGRAEDFLVITGP